MIETQTYHLRHLPDEDRLLISVDVAADREYAMMLTRRLAKELLAGLAAMLARQAQAHLPARPAIADTVLDFTHERAVAQAVADGDTRRHPGTTPLVRAPLIVREITLTPRENGESALAFKDGSNTLTLGLTPDRVHVFIAAILDIAAGAAWDLPPLAAWLDHKDGEAAEGSSRLKH